MKDKKEIHQRNKWKSNGNAIKSVIQFCSITQWLSNIRYLRTQKPKTGMPKRQMLSICQKKDIQLQNLPISKMNCADSTEKMVEATRNLSFTAWTYFIISG